MARICLGQNGPRLIDGDQAVAVAVEGEADVRFGLQDLLRQGLGVLGTAAEVDVLPVRFVKQGGHLRTQFGEGIRGDAVCGAVGAVQDDPASLEGVFLGEGMLQKNDVPAPGVFHAVGLAQFGRRGVERVQVVREDDRFDGTLCVIGKFIAIAAEDLDAVVLERIMRSRYDDASVGPHAVGEIGDPRCGDHTDQDGIDAHGTDSGNEGILQHVSGNARVFTDDDLGNMSLFFEEVGRGAADVHGHFRRDGVFIGDAPDSIRTEQFTHAAFSRDDCHDELPLLPLPEICQRISP